MYGRHRNGLGIDPKSGARIGTVIGSDGKEYYIGPGVDLTGAQLAGVNLRWADLTGATLEGANLEGADLTGAWLTIVSLGEANLRNSSLHGAGLHGAFLKGADLTGADLTDASFGFATVDPEHIQLIENEHREMMSTLKVNTPAPSPRKVISPSPSRRKVISPGRIPNPGGCSVTNTYLIVSPKDGSRRKRLVCGNGLSFALRAGNVFYCKPERNTGPWETVEVAYTSHPVPELFPYEILPRQRNTRDSVYGYVPVEVVDDIIEKNGGLSPTGNPGVWD